MNEIKNYDVYNQRMAKTLYDKCWWIDKIGDDINVVIDYGCGDGSLYDMIERICPNKFIYIGIDNDDNMLQLAEEKYSRPNCVFYNSIDKLIVDNLEICSDRIVFVMNSVIHEIFTYCTDECINKLFADIANKINPKYIAVRDMHAHWNTLGIDYEFDKEELDEIYAKSIVDSKYNQTYQDYCNSKSANHKNPYDHYAEFFLKYTYIENWDREKDETYLWDWSDYENGILRKIGWPYDQVYKNEFYIHYISQRIKKDFGSAWEDPTHMKVLYMRP